MYKLNEATVLGEPPTFLMFIVILAVAVQIEPALALENTENCLEEAKEEYDGAPLVLELVPVPEGDHEFSIN